MGEAPRTAGGAYRRAVETTLNWVLGDSAAKAILFYIGEPDPKTFETKLRSILGPGAAIVLEDLKRRQRDDKSALAKGG
jgi:hypothetical protein